MDASNKKIDEQLSHEKNPYYFPLYWLVNRDPYNYNGLLLSLYTWLVQSPIMYITQPTRVVFIAQLATW